MLVIVPEECSERDEEMLNMCPDVEPEPSHAIIESDVVIDNTPEKSDVCSVENFQVSLSNAVLASLGKLYSIDTLARSHVQLIVDYAIDLVNGPYMDILEAKAKKFNDSEFNNLFQSMKNMFAGLETEHKRLNEFKQSGAYIEPIPYVVGHAMKAKGSNGVIEPVNLYGQHIPVTKTLKAYFELPGVFKATLSYMEKLESQDGSVIENFIQGSLWKEKIKPLFYNKRVFPLCMYYDDYEPGDTAGKHPHKMGGTYFNIPCIPPEYRSCLEKGLENIFLATIFYAEDKDFGPDETFRRVLNDIDVLEKNGITIVVEGKEYQVYFVLCLVVGDNLGVHQVLGFAEGFTANYFCRRCKVHRTVTHTQTKVNPNLLRNKENYARDVAVEDLSSTGINSECVWNRFQAFHCVENVSYDLMHDLEEGAWDYDMTLLVSELIKRMRFTLQTLNNRVQVFDYGPCEKSNEPGMISADHLINNKFKFTAAEKLCFVRYFGFMVADMINPQADKNLWRFYEVIHELLSYLSSPKFRVVAAPIIAALISEHHALYLELFPGATLKPKHHLMLHYVEALLKNGPLILLSCWRFEGKHRPFQRYAKVNCNYSQLPLTYAIKHQLKFCQRLLSQKGFEIRLFTSKCQAVITECLKDYNSFHFLLPEQYRKEAFTLKKVDFNGITYSTDIVLVIRFTDEYPIFGKIKHILFDDVSRRVSYVLRAFHSVSFSSLFQAYEVTEIDEWCFTERNSLLTNVPSYDRIGPDGCRYVSFRYKL